MPNPKRHCRLCKKPVYGRTDKIFCTIACKNEYHVRLRRATARAVLETDKILHRNRSILLECLGKKKSQKRVHRSLLDKKKFNFQYHIPLPKRFGLCQTFSREYILDSKWFGVPNHFIVGIPATTSTAVVKCTTSSTTSPGSNSWMEPSSLFGEPDWRDLPEPGCFACGCCVFALNCVVRYRDRRERSDLSDLRDLLE